MLLCALPIPCKHVMVVPPGYSFILVNTTLVSVMPVSFERFDLVLTGEFNVSRVINT